MERCDRCGLRWCSCIPAGASVDWFTTVPPGPMLGPHQRDMDANMEILEEVADIYALPAGEWSAHLQTLAASWSPAQLAEALLVAVERVGIRR